MTISTAIGRHRAARTDDLLRMSFDGPVTRSDGEAMRVVMEAALREGFRCYLVADMRGCTGLDADARKYMTEWSRSGEQQLSGIVVYGISFAVRTMVSLTLAAIKFLGHARSEVVFVADEAEALRWVEVHRARARRR